MHFKTFNLSLAAAIQCVSTSKLECIDFSDQQRAEFVFDRSKDPSFDEIIQRFWNKSLPIDASSYFESLRYVKSRLYQEQNDKK